MALKSYNKLLEDKTANQIALEGKRRPYITETDTQFTKICLWLVYDVKKISRKITFKTLTAISCALKVLNRIT